MRTMRIAKLRYLWWRRGRAREAASRRAFDGGARWKRAVDRYFALNDRCHALSMRIDRITE